MLILDPVPVVIEDAEETVVEAPFSPKDPKMGTHSVKFTSKVYIERADFREEDSKDYFRLAPGKAVGLMNAPFPIKATSYTKDEATGKVTEIRAVYDKEIKKPKAFISWVGTEGSRRVEARVHNALFKSERPEDVEGGFLKDINPESEIIYPDAIIESGFDEVRRRAPWPEAAGESELGKGGPESVRFQAMRCAYFVRAPLTPELPLFRGQLANSIPGHGQRFDRRQDRSQPHRLAQGGFWQELGGDFDWRSEFMVKHR